MKPDLVKSISDNIEDLNGAVSPTALLMHGVMSNVVTADGVKHLVFNEDEKALVDSKIGPTDKLRCLIDIISRKPDEVFSWLMEYISSVGHGWLSDRIKGAIDEWPQGQATEKEVIQAIREYYSDLVASIQDTQLTVPYSLADVYIPMKCDNITMVPNSSEPSNFSHYSGIMNILRNEKQSSNRIALVIGNSGCGKTVLTKKIAYDWAKRHWLATGQQGIGWQLAKRALAQRAQWAQSCQKSSGWQLVILVNLGMICSKPRISTSQYEHSTILNAAINQFMQKPDYFRFDELAMRTVLDKYCLEHQGNVLFVCDGYDEYKPGYIEQLETLEMMIEDRPSLPPYRSALLITSRPFYTDKIQSVGHQFSLSEFEEADIGKFVDRFYKDPERKKRVTCLIMESMKQNPRLRFLARIPMMLTMICHIALDILNDNPSDRLRMLNYITTNAAIYQLYCDYLVRRWKARAKLTGSSSAYASVNKFADITGQATLFNVTFRFLTQQLPDGMLNQSTALISNSLMCKMGIIVATKSNITRKRVQDELLLTFVHRSFGEYFASKELLRMLKEDTLKDTLSLIGMRNATTPDHLPPLYQFIYRFRKSKTFRTNLNQVVQFACDLLSQKMRHKLKNAFTDDISLTIIKNNTDLLDPDLRSEVNSHEVMLDVDFKKIAHFCSNSDCEHRTCPTLINSNDSTIAEACFHSQDCIDAATSQIQDGSLKYVLLYLKFEQLSLDEIKLQLVELLRIIREFLTIVVEIEIYDESAKIRLTRFCSLLYEAIDDEHNAASEFAGLSLQAKRKYGPNRKNVLVNFLSLRTDRPPVFRSECELIVKKVMLLGLFGIGIGTENVTSLLETANNGNTCSMFLLDLKGNGFNEAAILSLSELTYEHTQLRLRIAATDHPLPTGVALQKWFAMNTLILPYTRVSFQCNFTHVRLSDNNVLCHIVAYIQRKLEESLRKHDRSHFIYILMNRCSLNDQNLPQLIEMCEGFSAGIGNDHSLMLEVVHNDFTHTGEQQLKENFKKWKGQPEFKYKPSNQGRRTSGSCAKAPERNPGDSRH